MNYKIGQRVEVLCDNIYHKAGDIGRITDIKKHNICVKTKNSKLYVWYGLPALLEIITIEPPNYIKELL